MGRLLGDSPIDLLSNQRVIVSDMTIITAKLGTNNKNQEKLQWVDRCTILRLIYLNIKEVLAVFDCV